MKNIDKILHYIKQIGKKVQFVDLKNKFSDINESTLVRNLNKLVEQGKIKKETQGKNTFYMIYGTDFIKDYLLKPFFERQTQKYNENFLRSYIPNKSSLLGQKYNDILGKVNFGHKLSTYDYKKNIRKIENMLIDISYASSKLEGNTYSYFDTQVLIKYNEEAQGKDKFETQMILNHKDALKYIIENKNKIKLDKKTFFEIHKILGKGLLYHDYLGNIRKNKVEIGGSTYKPLDNYYVLEQEFNLFLEKLNDIQNPFEQSIFILVFFPYLQIFMDINKRTSRIVCNIPLIKNGLPPLSLLQTKQRDYLLALLAIYELNEPALMVDIFVNNYLLNFDRYV